jgi:hypothetical protein
VGRLWLQARALVLLGRARVLVPRLGTSVALERLARPRWRWALDDPRLGLRAIRRAARIAGGNCLPQSVALTALLQRAGHAPDLILGCRRGGDGAWTAHAWVELGGDVLEPVVADEHAPLARMSVTNGWRPSPSGQPRGANR